MLSAASESLRRMTRLAKWTTQTLVKAFIKIPNLTDGHPAVHGVLGDKWLSHRVAAARNAMRRRSDLSPSMIGMTMGKLSHPLVDEVYHAADDSGSLRAETLVLDLLELDLQTLGENLPADIAPRLRNESDASKLMYELRIAAGFARVGSSIRWVPDTGAKRPEMLVNPEGPDSISVECKKRDASDGYEKEAEQFWMHFQHALRRRMGTLHLNHAVKVSAQRFRFGDVDRIVKEVIEALGSSPAGSITTSGGYQVEYLSLAGHGESISGELFNLFPRGVYGMNISQIDRGQLRRPRFAGDRAFEGPALNPKILRLELEDNPERRVRGVLRNLKAASRQVQAGMPSVVYIDLNLGTYVRETAEFDAIVSKVRAELARTHTRISAVVLTALEPTRTRDQVPVWWVRTEMIEQTRSQHPLPRGLRLPGSDSAGQWIPGECHTVDRATTN